SSYDGSIRLYAAGNYLVPVAKAKSPVGDLPYGVAFSPDGGCIAVGNYQVPGIAVLSGQGLRLLYQPDISNVVSRADVSSVAWSTDGRHLFAGGDQDMLARRWSDSGRGPSNDFFGAYDAVMQFIPLHDGRMMFAEQSGFGVIDSQGEVNRLQDTGGLDF